MSLSPIPTVPDLPHALAHALLTVHDSGVADLVDLEFATGLWRRAHLAPHLLRLGERLPGRWTATLFLRTDRHGRLREQLHVVNLQEPVEGTSPFTWSALGRPVELDRDTGRVSLRIIPKPPRVRPFLVTARATPDTMNWLTGAELSHLRGGLEGERLLVEEVSSSGLREPFRHVSGEPCT
ncbi:hypothetical protein [Deinococcus carri]|uniref:hypothetical protein n=1 Tax=Deinococcus carri TaxID=1211323 RepID=UPI0031F1741C